MFNRIHEYSNYNYLVVLRYFLLVPIDILIGVLIVIIHFLTVIILYNVDKAEYRKTIDSFTDEVYDQWSLDCDTAIFDFLNFFFFYKYIIFWYGQLYIIVMEKLVKRYKRKNPEKFV